MMRMIRRKKGILNYKIISKVLLYVACGVHIRLNVCIIVIGTKKDHKHEDLQLPQWETPMNSNRHLLDKFDGALVSPTSPGKGPDLPIFALGVVRTATDDFSLANKLGEGGFGPVYKVIIS